MVKKNKILKRVEIKKKSPNEKLTREIINITDAVRKKHLQLKLQRSGQDELLQKMFKPVSEPLKKIVDANKFQIENIKSERFKKEEIPASPDVKERHLTTPVGPVTPVTDRLLPKSLLRQPDFLEDESVFTATPEASTSADPVDSSFRSLYQSMSERVLDDFYENINPIARNYLDGFFKDTRNVYDSTYGVTYEPDVNKLKLGNKIVKFEGDSIVIGKKRYEGSAGLFELIFKSNPKKYTDDELKRYHEILEYTSAHRRSNDSVKQLKGNGGLKWKRIIKPLTLAKQKQPSKSWSGRGANMFVKNTPYQYIYWDDINELIDRLRLLVASENAGHTNHNNEMLAIIEELRDRHNYITFTYIFFIIIAMSTDKFGRHSNKVQATSSAERIFKRRPAGFPLTSDGDVNIGGKRIRFMADPIAVDDSVNKRYVLKLFADLEKENLKNFSALHHLKQTVQNHARLTDKQRADIDSIASGLKQYSTTSTMEKLINEKVVELNKTNEKIAESVRELRNEIITNANKTFALILDDMNILSKAKTEHSNNYRNLKTRVETLNNNISKTITEINDKIRNIEELLTTSDISLDTLETKKILND